MSEPLTRIAVALERIADHLMLADTEAEAIRQDERERVLARLKEASRHWRYRNVCFDGMDNVLTAVVPLGGVERALHKALVAKPGTFTMDRVSLDAVPAIGEKRREDV